MRFVAVKQTRGTLTMHDWRGWELPPGSAHREASTAWVLNTSCVKGIHVY